MLVFRRQRGESFMVGETVEVRILEIGRHQVKIGVVAPREVTVYRTEIARMNQRAALDNLKDPQVRGVLASLQGVFQKRKRP